MTPETIALKAPAMDELGVSRRGFKLLAGTANRALAEEISNCLSVDLTKVTISRFADGEIFVRIDENVRGPTCSSCSRRIRRRKTSWSSCS